jgi:hypothetical protein
MSLRSTLQADSPVVLAASYQLNSADRRVLDNQVVELQQLLVDCLIRGWTATFYTLSASSDAVIPGDLVVVSYSDAAGRTVTKFTAASAVSAGMVAGMVVTSAAPGTLVLTITDGIIPPYLTGLGAVSGLARANATTGRAERVAAHSEGEYPVGAVDGIGNLTLCRRTPWAVTEGTQNTTARVSIVADFAADADVASLSGLSETPDGGTLTDGLIVHCTAQTDGIENGPWVAHSGAWTRPTAYAAGGHASGILVVVREGTLYHGTLWACDTKTAEGDVIGTDETSWECRTITLPVGNANTVYASDGGVNSFTPDLIVTSVTVTGALNTGVDPATGGELNLSYQGYIYSKDAAGNSRRLFGYQGNYCRCGSTYDPLRLFSSAEMRFTASDLRLYHPSGNNNVLVRFYPDAAVAAGYTLELRGQDTTAAGSVGGLVKITGGEGVAGAMGVALGWGNISGCDRITVSQFGWYSWSTADPLDDGVHGGNNPCVGGGAAEFWTHDGATWVRSGYSDNVTIVKAYETVHPTLVHGAGATHGGKICMARFERDEHSTTDTTKTFDFILSTMGGANWCMERKSVVFRLTAEVNGVNPSTPRGGVWIATASFLYRGSDNDLILLEESVQNLGDNATHGLPTVSVAWSAYTNYVARLTIDTGIALEIYWNLRVECKTYTRGGAEE